LWEFGALLADAPDRLTTLRAACQSPLELAWACTPARLAEEAVLAAAEVPDAEPAAFAALCLEFEQWTTLLDWIHEGEPPALRWSQSLENLTTMLANDWRPGALPFLEPDAPAFVRWTAAESLAQAGRLRAAARCEVPDAFSGSERDAALLKLAGWRLATRDLAGACAALDALLASEPALASLTDPYFAALRARAAIADGPHLDAFVSQLSGPRRAAAELVLAATRKQEDGFRDAARQWVGLGGSTTDWLVQAGQLQQWHLYRQARELLRQTIPHKTFIERDLQQFIASSLLLESLPPETDFLAREWIAQRLPGLEDVAAKSAGMGRTATARAIHEAAFAANPANPETWTQLLSLAALPEGFSAVPLRWYQGASSAERKTIPAQTLFDALNAAVSGGEAQTVLSIVSDRSDLELVRARALHKLGRTDEAHGLLRKLAEQDPHMPELARVGRELGAAVGDTHMETRVPDPLASFLEAPSEAALEDLLHAWPKPGQRIAAAEAILTKAPDFARSLSPQGWDHVLAPARESKAQAAPLIILECALAKLTSREAELRRTLTTRVLAGDALAAEGLIRLEMVAKDAHELLRAVDTWLKLAASRHRGAMARYLLKQRCDKAAVAVLDAMDQDGLADHSLALAYAEALWRLGRKDEANAISEAIAAAAAVDPALHVSLAGYHLAIGDADGARTHLDSPHQPLEAFPQLSALRKLLESADSQTNP
jgi:tetratricopeptide (TPR) repeat protein